MGITSTSNDEAISSTIMYSDLERCSKFNLKKFVGVICSLREFTVLNVIDLIFNVCLYIYTWSWNISTECYKTRLYGVKPIAEALSKFEITARTRRVYKTRKGAGIQPDASYFGIRKFFNLNVQDIDYYI